MNKKVPIPLIMALVVGIGIWLLIVVGRQDSESTDQEERKASGKSNAAGATESVEESGGKDEEGKGKAGESGATGAEAKREPGAITIIDGEKLSQPKEPSDPVERLMKPGSGNGGAGSGEGNPPGEAIFPLVTSAPDFPYNLKTFEEWETISTEDMESYQRSLMSRVGRWDAEEVGSFFHRVHDKLDGEETKSAFREAVLGTWCSKDVDGCLHSLEENLPPDVAIAAKRDALAGFSDQDWMTALQYLRKHGDTAIEERLGGDSTEFVGNVVNWMAREGGRAETEQLIASLEQPKNREAAELAFRGKKAQ